MGFSTDDALAPKVSEGFHLSDLDPATTPGLSADDNLDKEFAQHDDELGELQENLFASKAGSVLVILQGMDTSGKGGMIERLLKPMSPLGTRVVAFGAPTKEEREQDFLWRVRPHLPKAGEIAVFDRSHYEDVLIQKVESMADPAEIERRYAAISDFESEIAASGTTIIKVFLHISREFQYENLVERLTNPEKMWKYDPADLVARSKWEEYMTAYQIAMERTSTDDAPWYVIPGDDKTYARMVVKHLLVDALRDLERPWPGLGEGVDADEELEKLKKS
ncbi:PPK2 family polyphosphate kinase [Corynebacterium doosanense]|uniref:Polyphosphate kinase n=1 Tax=Corynebacterium doosanense CAU 212 = DSM 45436 TaxID=558173 RepID=A0A097IGB3_9CORY|nr:PPK2 family polyphosphate kinase [Corynebacterium doosanense]AIT61171.1 polyphosphate kinase [Corynebacterium doosanense CAU 212 = DSM 45436]